MENARSDAGRIGVALSGGGHRAALFGLGVLLCLSDCGRNSRVVAIASVSGGSITNGFVAQEGDFHAQSATEFERVAKRLAGQIAQRGTLWAYSWTWIYVALLVSGFVAIWIVWFLPWPVWARTVVFTVALVLWATGILSQRGFVCGRAYARTLFSPKGEPTKLDELNRSVEHVICVTELHSGEHLYFSSRFVYSWRIGWGRPNGLPLHAAVQASTAMPGAFPPRWFRASRFGFEGGQGEVPRLLAALDGGVYDNMADQWLSGLTERSRTRHAPQLELIDEMIIVNSSAPMEWGSVTSIGLPLWGEIAALVRSKDILYDNTTAQRRAGLIGRFDRAAMEALVGPNPEDPIGALVMISQSPYLVPKAYSEGRLAKLWPDRCARARNALERLPSTGLSEEQWEDATNHDSKIPTTLSKLGKERAARLIHHAYVLAGVNAHVILGWPLVELPDRNRFEDLVA